MNILESLMSSEKPTFQRFSMYLPDRGKPGSAAYELAAWVEGALHLLTSINGGGTTLPNCPGGWEGADGGFMVDNTTIVYSLIRRPDVFEDRFDEIVAFISLFGRATEQEAVMVELSDGHRAYFIEETEYV